MTGHFIDLDTWTRRAQYEWFRPYEMPFFNICAEVEVTHPLATCRTQGHSFFLATWFACQQAINAEEALRLRLRGDRVWLHDRIEIGSTVLNPDQTFSFCYLPYGPTFEAFAQTGREALDALQARGGGLDVADHRDDLIHGSVLPWLRFTGLTHARRLDPTDSTPKIAFGRHTDVGQGRTMMPVSVEVHHALVDGLDVARFFQHLQAALDRFPDAP